MIAKFYRPGRWSGEQIREEHQWSLELASAALPVIAPLQQAGETLFSHGHYAFALYPRAPGTPVALVEDDQLYALGQLIGQVHQQAAAPFSTARASARTQMGLSICWPGLLPTSLARDYLALSDKLTAAIDAVFARPPLTPANTWRCTRGNVLWQEDGPLSGGF